MDLKYETQLSPVLHRGALSEEYSTEERSIVGSKYETHLNCSCVHLRSKQGVRSLTLNLMRWVSLYDVFFPRLSQWCQVRMLHSAFRIHHSNARSSALIALYALHRM